MTSRLFATSRIYLKEKLGNEILAGGHSLKFFGPPGDHIIFLEKQAKSFAPVMFLPTNIFGWTWYWYANFSSLKRSLKGSKVLIWAFQVRILAFKVHNLNAIPLRSPS